MKGFNSSCVTMEGTKNSQSTAAGRNKNEAVCMYVLLCSCCCCTYISSIVIDVSLNIKIVLKSPFSKKEKKEAKRKMLLAVYPPQSQIVRHSDI
jgi:hypothetical protein